MRGCVPCFGQTHGSAPTVYTPRSICVTLPTNCFLAPLNNARFAPPARLQLRRSYVRPMAARIVYRSICDCCVCPIDSTRLPRPAWHKLRLCCTRLFAARAIYGSICVTSPTNCPIELRPNSAALGIMQVNLPSALACTFLPSPKFGCARHNASKLAFCSRLHFFAFAQIRLRSA